MCHRNSFSIQLYLRQLLISLVFFITLENNKTNNLTSPFKTFDLVKSTSTALCSLCICMPTFKYSSNLYLFKIIIASGVKQNKKSNMVFEYNNYVRDVVNKCPML